MINNTKSLPISKACLALGASKSGYYKWKNREPIKKDDKAIKKEIEGITLEFPCYGYRRVTKELHRRGVEINHKKTLKIMKEENILCRRKKAFRPVTTNSNHNHNICPNFIKNLEVTGLNQVWVADITYIGLPNEFIYLAAIIDIFSRKCIGWELGKAIDNSLTLNALYMAISKRKCLGLCNLIHHSDRGAQYASGAYVELLKKCGIRISMSAPGNPYENAYAESFNKTLKVEEVYVNEYETFEEALKNIKHFINIVYNKKRLHSSIGYVPPEEFEMGVIKQ